MKLFPFKDTQWLAAGFFIIVEVTSDIGNYAHSKTVNLRLEKIAGLGMIIPDEVPKQ